MPNLLAIVPAAGSGARFGGDIPKQYRALLGRPMLAHALSILCAEPRIGQVAVVLANDDDWFARFDWKAFAPKLTALKCGGDTRAQTVRNALSALAGHANDDDWILVHDAARPCLDAESLSRLIGELAGEEIGGLLAIPVTDTLKKGGAGDRAVGTLSRDALWQAQTPQMFRRALLLRALQCADATITDESGAVEALGLQPKLVSGSSMNLKVTYARDFALAEAIIAMRNKEKT